MRKVVEYLEEKEGKRRKKQNKRKTCNNELEGFNYLQQVLEDNGKETPVTVRERKKNVYFRTRFITL